MSHPVPLQFQPVDAEAVIAAPGRVALVVDEGGKLGLAGRKLDKAMKGALARYLASEAFGSLKSGEAADLAWPAGLAAEVVQVVKLDRKADAAQARKAGAAVIARRLPTGSAWAVAARATAVSSAIVRPVRRNRKSTLPPSPRSAGN